MNRQALKLVTASLVTLLAISGCSSMPKYGPKDLAKKSQLTIADVRAAIGSETGKSNENFGTFYFDTDLSLDREIKFQGFGGSQCTECRGRIKYFTISNPKTSRTVNDIKSAWGMPYSESKDRDGSWSATYKFPMDNGKDVSVGVSSNPGSEIIRGITWDIPYD